jgi:phage portal protein BeeE
MAIFGNLRAKRLTRKAHKLVAQANRTPEKVARETKIGQAKRLSDRADQLRSGTVSDLSQWFTLVTSPPNGYLMPAVGFSDSNLTRLLMASAWSWAAITGNSKAMASVPVIIQRRVGGSWVTDPAHPLNAFVTDPLGRDDNLPYWSWQQLFYVTAVHRYIAGNAYWIPVDVNGQLDSVGVWFNPGGVTAVENIYKAPIEYKLTGYQGTIVKPASEVVNIMAPSPDSYWQGLAPLSVALRAIETDYQAAERQRYNLRNKVAPGMIVSIETPLGPNPTQRTNVKDELIDNYQSAENDGTPWVIGGAAKIHPPLTSTELQYFDTRAFSRDEILAVIGMPPPVAGVLDRAILNNFTAANTLWWNHYLVPVINEIYGAINAQLVRKYYPAGDVRIWYDLTGSDVALQLFRERIQVGLELQKLGYCTNDINSRLGLEMPEHEYLDLPNTQLIQAGRTEEMTEAVEETDGSEESETTETETDAA